MIKLKASLQTNGRGLWSSASKDVSVTGIKIDPRFGEMRVYFDTKSWDISNDGLIYTDQQFLQELRWLLDWLGFSRTKDVNYSEQGMQGDDYVSLDTSDKFIAENVII